MPGVNVVCLTAVRNEAWILRRFLACASYWATHIILADQHSTDETREIAREFPAVRLVANDSVEFDEARRREILLEAARAIPGPRLLIALDADEILTADAWATAEWGMMLHAPPGTAFRFALWNLRPGLARCWDEPCEGLWGFMDDGSAYAGAPIHCRRLPLPDEANVIDLQQIAVLHYQYTDWARMRAKQRWYQCMELFLRPERGALEMYRLYRHMDAVPRRRVRSVPAAWFAGYEARGVDMRSVASVSPYWFDQEVLALFEQLGTGPFRRRDLWQADWQTLARQSGHPQAERFRDPRSWYEKAVHHWLRATQRRRDTRWVRRVDRWLQQHGW